MHAALVLSSASRGEWEAWDRHLWQARRRLAGSGLVLEEVARIATLAGELAAGAGDGRRAAEAWGLALGQWRALGRTEEANDLQGRLDSDLP